MIIKSKIIILLILNSLVYPILSQKKNKISLPQNSAYHLHLDSNNNLWISSIDGTYIYDGKHAKRFSNHNSNIIGNNNQSSFYEDENSNIWFTTYIGLNLYNNRLNTFYNYSLNNCHGEPINENYSILGYKHPLLYLKADSCFHMFDIEKRKSIKCLNLNLSDFSNLNNNAVITNHEIIISGRKNSHLKIEVYNKNGILKKEKKLNGIPNIQNIIPVKNQFILSRDNYIYSYNIKTDSLNLIYTAKSKIEHFYLYSKSKAFILTNELIIIYNITKSKVEATYSINSNGHKTAIFTKDANTIFYSVDRKGVYHFNIKKNKFTHYKIGKDSIILNARSPKENKSNFFFASIDNGIKLTDENFKLKNKFTPNQEYKLIYDIEKNSKEEWFANGGYFIYKYNSEKNKFEKININENKTDYYFDIFINKNDQIYLLDGAEEGFKELVKTNNNTYVLKNTLHENENDKFLAAFELKDSSIILGNNGYSLSYFNYGKGSYQLISTHKIESDIKSVWEIPNSKEVYVSSSSGLFHFPNGLNNDFNRISDEKSLLNQTIYYILGHKEYLYLSSNQGLLRYNTIDSSVHQFTLADGIQGLEFNTTAGLIDSKGRFIFGGTNGINTFHPDSISLLDYNTSIHLSNILINDDEYNWETNITLKDSIKFDYENNTLTFKFHGIDYSDPQGIELKCKMENYDKDWIFFDKNEGIMRYPNLPPGHYTFNMLATNSDKVWSNKIRTIDVIITPPLWQTWWFRLSTLLIISGLIWLSFKSYYKRKLIEKDLELREQHLAFEKQQALQNERNRIAAEMHDDLGGGLTSIKFLAHRILRKKEDTNPIDLINKIVIQSGELINNMSEIIWAMNSGYDSLNNLVVYIRNHIKRQCETFEISYSEDITKDIDSTEITSQKRRNTFLVMKEAMHNVIKHSNASQVKMTAKVSSSHLTMTLTDNGDGIKQENQFGNGLRNMKKRMADIGGEFNITNINGTKIIISFPLI